MEKENLPKILIVDASQENLLAMEKHFQGMSVNIFKAQSADQALSLVLEHDFAVVLLDVHMPEMDGFEMAKIMHSNKRTARIPIIFVTTIPAEKQASPIEYERGAVDYIVKPFDQDILTAKVKIFLEFFTQKKEIETANLKLNQANIQLEKANTQILEQRDRHVEKERLKVLLDMAGTTAHELNQPLMQLLGTIELIDLCKKDPAKVEELLDKIKDAGIRISQVVQKIQTLRHYETRSYIGQSQIINIDQDIQILCIDDSKKDFNKIEKALASRTDVKLFHAGSLKKAWSMIQDDDTYRFDLIFLDFMLPDGTGYHFLTQFSQKDLLIPVIVITNKKNDDNAARLIQTGALDFLPKSKISEKSLYRIIDNAMEYSRLKYDLERMQEKLVQSSSKDVLTGLHNSRSFLESLKTEIKRVGRYKESFSLLMIEVDYFSDITHVHGIRAGNTTLAEIAKVLTRTIRQSDIAGRFGGEEFAVILPHTDTRKGMITAEKIRKKVEKTKFFNEGTPLKVSVSIGVYEFEENDATQRMIQNADKALSIAKKNGRNQSAPFPA